MLQLDPNSLFTDLIKVLGTGIIAFLLWFARLIHTRLARLECRIMPRAEIQTVKHDLEQKLSSKVDSDDFREFMQRAEIARQESRNAQISLFDKLDNLKTMIINLSHSIQDK